jgi:hypothetical protein
VRQLGGRRNAASDQAFIVDCVFLKNALITFHRTLLTSGI